MTYGVATLDISDTYDFFNRQNILPEEGLWKRYSGPIRETAEIVGVGVGAVSGMIFSLVIMAESIDGIPPETLSHQHQWKGMSLLFTGISLGGVTGGKIANLAVDFFGN